MLMCSPDLFSPQMLYVPDIYLCSDLHFMYNAGYGMEGLDDCWLTMIDDDFGSMVGEG